MMEKSQISMKISRSGCRARHPRRKGKSGIPARPSSPWPDGAPAFPSASTCRGQPPRGARGAASPSDGRSGVRLSMSQPRMKIVRRAELYRRRHRRECGARVLDHRKFLGARRSPARDSGHEKRRWLVEIHGGGPGARPVHNLAIGERPVNR